MLGRRELSEAQVRQRLARRGYDEQAIDEAIGRLKEERAIDDDRVAEAVARVETSTKRRGRMRVRRQIESMGISASIARRAVDETFGALDEQQLVEASLARRLQGRGTIRSDAEFARLYRYLTAQGFEHDRVMKALKNVKSEA